MTVALSLFGGLTSVLRDLPIRISCFGVQPKAWNAEKEDNFRFPYQGSKRKETKKVALSYRP